VTQTSKVKNEPFIRHDKIVIKNAILIHLCARSHLVSPGSSAGLQKENPATGDTLTAELETNF